MIKKIYIIIQFFHKNKNTIIIDFGFYDLSISVPVATVLVADLQELKRNV